MIGICVHSNGWSICRQWLKARPFSWRLGLALLAAITFACAAPDADARGWFGERWHAAPDSTATIAVGELPIEAQRTLAAIRSGAPLPYPKDGIVFGNRERLLPIRPRGYYSEYTVRTPGLRGRGARRIIAGDVSGSTPQFYYSDDHYHSFRRIQE